MADPVRALIVEDSEDDTLLVVREMRRDGLDVMYQRVETAESMKAALESATWDVVISDFKMPHFSAPAALRLLQGTRLDLPFIIVSGTIGEEVAVDAMKAGAHDYILKGNLTRLAPAVRREIEQAARRRAGAEAENRYRRIFENAVEGIFQTTPEGRFITVNPRFAQILGYSSPEELMAAVHDLAAQSWVHPEQRAEYRRLLETQGSVRGFEFELRRRDGTIATVSESSRVVRDSAGGPRFYEGTLEDVSERKRAQEELARSELYYRSLIENALDMTVVLAPEGHLRYVSPSVERILGHTRDAVQGLSAFDLIHPDDRPLMEVRFREALEGGSRFEYLECRARHRDGSWRTLSIMGKPLPPETGTAGIILNAHDLTERQRLEAQLRQSQKMEAVGRLAGGVAHDFNNILTVIQGYGELLRPSVAGVGPDETGLDEILKAAERATTLTRQLLAFSRRQVLEPSILRLDAVVANMEKMLRRLIGEDVELVVAAEADLGNVKADPGQIEQVLMNLAVNARDAMPKGGRLTIGVANAEVDEALAKEGDQPAAGFWVVLTVTDTGVGMSAELLSHLFEPFFTTKEKGKGTGLGLATVYGIVKQSGGYIWPASAPGKGTTFRIYLPRVKEAAAERGPVPVSDGAGGSETILVVEDEEAVRRLAVSVLASRGYNVLEAAGPVDGLDLAARHPGQIDLLLSDVVMPGMTGREMAARLVAQRPGLRVLYMSGYFDDAIARDGAFEPPGIRLLRKPFTPTTLSRAVGEVLGRPAGVSSGT